jgi:hypothetical protein
MRGPPTGQFVVGAVAICEHKLQAAARGLDKRFLRAPPRRSLSTQEAAQFTYHRAMSWLLLASPW